MNHNRVACLCEGSAEQAILDILLENNVLIFNELLDDKILRVRSAKNFEEQYLRKGNLGDITVYRVLDSRKENFNLSPLYKGKVTVINVITHPEIEILYIHSVNKFEDFRKSKLKASEYCRTVLKVKKIKSYDFVKNTFSDISKLISVIQMYKTKSITPKGECTLFDIIKPNVIIENLE